MILYISNTHVQVKNMFAHLHEAKHFLGNIASHSDPARNGIISQLRVSMTSVRFSLPNACASLSRLSGTDDDWTVPDVC